LGRYHKKRTERDEEEIQETGSEKKQKKCLSSDDTCGKRRPASYGMEPRTGAITKEEKKSKSKRKLGVAWKGRGRKEKTPTEGANHWRNNSNTEAREAHLTSGRNNENGVVIEKKRECQVSAKRKERSSRQENEKKKKGEEQPTRKSQRDTIVKDGPSGGH